MMLRAVEANSWASGAFGAVPLFAAGGTVTSQRWSKPLIYAFSVAFALQWLFDRRVPNHKRFSKLVSPQRTDAQSSASLCPGVCDVSVDALLLLRRT